MTTLERPQVEQALQGAIDAVESLFAIQTTHSGSMHVALVGGHESAIAKALLPRLNGTRLGHLIRTYGREMISEYR